MESEALIEFGTREELLARHPGDDVFKWWHSVLRADRGTICDVVTLPDGRRCVVVPIDAPGTLIRVTEDYEFVAMDTSDALPRVQGGAWVNEIAHAMAWSNYLRTIGQHT